MENRNYFGEFKDWSDVRGNYGGECPREEPRYVFAEYEMPPYEGYSTVVISSNGRQFSVVEGSHCSCYGLEDQWQPTQHSVTELRKMMEAKFGFFHVHRDDLEKWFVHIR